MTEKLTLNNSNKMYYFPLQRNRTKVKSGSIIVNSLIQTLYRPEMSVAKKTFNNLGENI